MKSKRTIGLPSPNRVIISALVLFLLSFTAYLISAQQVSAAACTAPPATAYQSLTTRNLG